MALATTCPQCKTSFKVVPDQLKLRRGLVRCGVCQHVFSGIDYLRYVDDAARNPVPAGGGSERFAAEAPPATPGAAPFADSQDLHTAFFLPETVFANTGQIASMPAPGAQPTVPPESIQRRGGDPHETTRHHEEPGAYRDETGAYRDETGADRDETGAYRDESGADRDETGAYRDETGADRDETGGYRGDSGEPVRDEFFDDDAGAPSHPAGTALAEEPARAPAPQAARGAGAETEADAIDFFTPNRRARGFSSRGAALGWLACAALTVLLFTQLAAGARHWLAARVPALAPAIAAMVGPLGLSIEPPRELEALTIESFELQASGVENLYSMSALLRNHGDHAVHWPAMELSLTDSSGAVVVRKVLRPADYLAGSPSAAQPRAQAGAPLAAPPGSRRGIGAGAELAVRVALEAHGVSPTGYTVNLFYP